MYVTRPLSLYRTDPSALSSPPPEGPNSGVLVIQDDQAQPTCCFGACNSNQIKDMPFPQNFDLKAWHQVFVAQSTVRVYYPVVFIPVINKPLSSNRYYVIEHPGKHKGKESVKSKEDSTRKCAYCGSVSVKKPEELPGRHREFEVCKTGSRRVFALKPSSAGAYTPAFTARGFWQVETSSKPKFLLQEAPGLDAELRARLPDFNFPLSEKTSGSVEVGKWYTPFIFIKEETLEDQVNNSRFYEITLDQRWEQIFSCENTKTAGSSVTMDIEVQTEVAAIAGTEVCTDKKNIADGFTWFKSSRKDGEERRVGLSLGVMERMKWEQKRVGWKGRSGAKKKVKRVEEYGGKGEWRKFGLYVLVERFLIKRGDGRLVLSYEFNHTHQIRTKWE